MDIPITKAFVLAGGEGTRLKPYTDNVPKCLLPINKKPLLEHLISHLREQGVKEVILSVGHMSDKLISYFGDGGRLGVAIKYVVEDEKLGTAGPLRLAKEHLTEPFLMMNGDILSRVNLNEMYSLFLSSNVLGTIALITVDDPSRFGVVQLEGQIIKRFVEKPKKEEAPSNLVNAGIYILDPKVIDFVPKSGFSMIERDVFPKLAENGKLSGYVYNGEWYDIGTIESYAQVCKEWK